MMSPMPEAAPQMDIGHIMSVLPHRYPFLLVDRVLDVEPGKKLRAIKCVTVNELFFQGHFPGVPVMPGVLILESLAQAGGLLVHASVPFDPKDKLFYLMAIDRARFRRVVTPGDQLLLEISITRHKGAVWRMKGVARVGPDVAAEAEILAGVQDRKDT